jgi:activator of HSP90 ATPase
MPKNVITAASLPTPPDKLFDMYLDPQMHGAFTGHSVVIGSKPGSEFSAFDGRISGKILHVEPKRLIVQTWRSVHFPPDVIDSTLVLTFWPETNGGRIELNHINVADNDFAGISHGWEQHYWTPWRAWLTSKV